MEQEQRHSPYSGLKRFRAGWLGLLAATIIALYLCWLMLRSIVDVALWSGVLVIIFYPLHQALVRRNGRPSLSALMSCLLVALTILLPLSLVAVVVVNEAVNGVEYLQGNYDRLLDPNLPAMRWIGRFVDVPKLIAHFSTPEALKATLEELGPSLAPSTGVAAANLAMFVVKILLGAVTMFYLFRDGERILEKMREMLPLHPSQSLQIFRRTREVINASMNGVLVIAVIQGILGGIAFWFLGLPSPLLWGAVMVLLSTIPLIGSTVVWIPTALYLLATGHWMKATILVVWGGIIIASVDNLLRPRLVGGKTRLHELLVFFSVIGGLRVFGILGIVIGPVIVAITLALLDVFRKADRPPEATAAEPTLAEIQSNLREVPPEKPPASAA